MLILNEVYSTGVPSSCMSYFCVYLFIIYLPQREKELCESVSRVSFEDSFFDHCVFFFKFQNISFVVGLPLKCRPINQRYNYIGHSNMSLDFWLKCICIGESAAYVFYVLGLLKSA